MTIIRASLPDDLEDSARQCFFCFRSLTAPAVAWMGSTATIGLHPGCAVELMIRVMRDVHQVECETQRYVTGPRTLDELRMILIASEHLS